MPLHAPQVTRHDLSQVFFGQPETARALQRDRGRYLLEFGVQMNCFKNSEATTRPARAELKSDGVVAGRGEDT